MIVIPGNIGVQTIESEFPEFGIDGLNTDIARDHDHYLASKLKEIGSPDLERSSDGSLPQRDAGDTKAGDAIPAGAPVLCWRCFPPDFQAIPLYVLATVIVFGFVLLAISLARTWPAILPAAALGCLTLYLMINPTKASYSMAPTTVICVLAAFFTARLFATEQRRNRFALSALVGFLIGLAVDFRLPNLFLSSWILRILLRFVFNIP